MEKINYKSDFTFRFAVNLDGANVDLTKYSWRMTFTTSGADSPFVVSRVEGTDLNCATTAKLTTAYVNSHDLWPGELVVEFMLHIPDAHFADGIRTLVTKVNTGILLTEGEPNVSELSEYTIMLPQGTCEGGLLTGAVWNRQVFIDMWNTACESYGRYNEATGYFELNGLTDITYEQAVNIYRWYDPSGVQNMQAAYFGSKCRTFIPFHSGYVQPDCYALLRGNAYVEAFESRVQCGRWHEAFLNCTKLKSIHIDDYYSRDDSACFTGCTALTTLKIGYLKRSQYIGDSPLITAASFEYIISHASNTGAVTLTVHPDVYAKLTDERATEWSSLVEKAAAKNISFASA